MKRRFLCIVATLLSAYGIRGQSLNEAFLKSTVLVTFATASGGQSAGTGFLVFREVETGKGHVLLVTNKHVLPPEGSEVSVDIRVVTKTGERPEVRTVRVPLVGRDGKYLPNVRLHPDAGCDVAAINVTEQVVGEKIEATWLPVDLLASAERLKNEDITVGDEIFLLGYPDAIFDVRNASPLLRRGVIASVPLEGYSFNASLRRRFGLAEHIDGFLIDASVFPGSSGSLVILKQQPTTLGPGGETVVSGKKKIPYILGIVSGSLPITDTAIGSTQRMGLGIVYSANAIRETIERFYAGPQRAH